MGLQQSVRARSRRAGRDARRGDARLLADCIRMRQVTAASAPTARRRLEAELGLEQARAILDALTSGAAPVLAIP